jgi:hypothetical protein
VRAGACHVPRVREAERHYPHWVVMTIKGLSVYKALDKAPGHLTTCSMRFAAASVITIITIKLRDV